MGGGEHDSERQAYVGEIESLKKACRDWEQNTQALRQNVEDLATQLQVNFSEKEKNVIVRSGIRTHAWRTRLRPERSALDRSAILTCCN